MCLPMPCQKPWGGQVYEYEVAPSYTTNGGTPVFVCCLGLVVARKMSVIKTRTPKSRRRIEIGFFGAGRKRNTSGNPRGGPKTERKRDEKIRFHSVNCAAKSQIFLLVSYWFSGLALGQVLGHDVRKNCQRKNKLFEGRFLC